ncbi:MAG: ABC transporter ATP-binding protein [bacterium]|nr:ABC transporter ATP-binding protein [bacterium]
MIQGSSIEINHLSVDYPLPFNWFLKKQLLGTGQTHSHHHFRALHNISLNISPGERVGVVGMNGAGKTTLFRTMAGALNPANGTMIIDGVEASSPDRQPVGYMAAFPLIYRQLTGYENLRFIANLYHIKHSEERIKKMAEIVGLSDVIDKYVEQYSTGMVSRLDFARVLLPDPSLIILDEPFGAFDLHFAEEAKEIIMKSKATIILATHNLEDIENMTERLILLHRGELVRDVNFTDLSEVAPTHVGKKTLSIIEFVQGLLRKTLSGDKNYCPTLHKKHVLSK